MRFPRQESGNSNPLQHSCLENPTDRGAWWATVHGVSDTTEQLSLSHTHTQTHPSHRHPPTSPRPGYPMRLKQTLLHASTPGNSVLNERISCLFQDATQPAAEPPREGPPGNTRSPCAFPHGRGPGSPGSTHQPSCASFLILLGADTSSRHSRSLDPAGASWCRPQVWVCGANP